MKSISTFTEKFDLTFSLAPFDDSFTNVKETKPKCVNRIAHFFREDTSKSDSAKCVNSQDLVFTIINYLSQEKCVNKVLLLKEKDLFHVWTVIDEYNNENNRKSVYRQECNLMKYMAKINLHFDFYLIESEEVKDTLSSGAVIVYERKVSTWKDQDI